MSGNTFTKIKVENQDLLTCLASVKELEQRSEYDAAIELLQPVWFETRKSDLNELSTKDDALVLLRYGSLMSRIARAKQVPRQDYAITLLRIAIEIFETTEDQELLSEAFNSLAFCYLLEGDLPQCEFILAHSLSLRTNPVSESRIQAQYYQGIVLSRMRRYEDAVNVFLDLLPFAEEYSDDFYLAGINNDLGLAYKNLNLINEALDCFTIAERLFKKTENHRFYAMVENNLARLYMKTGDYLRAHRHVLKSLNTYRQLRDVGREAIVLDTEAQIFLEEGLPKEALRVIDSSISKLIRGEDFGLLLDSYETKYRILLELNEPEEALTLFSTACGLAAKTLGQEKAAEFTSEFNARYEEYLIKKGLLPVAEDTKPAGSETKKITIPLSPRDGIILELLEIAATDFSCYFPAGSLILVVRTENVGNNEFGVLRDKHGVFHFGLITYYAESNRHTISLTKDGFPEILDKPYKVFGKIVGYCTPEEARQNSVRIQLLID